MITGNSSSSAISWDFPSPRQWFTKHCGTCTSWEILTPETGSTTTIPAPAGIWDDLPCPVSENDQRAGLILQGHASRCIILHDCFGVDSSHHQQRFHRLAPASCSYIAEKLHGGFEWGTQMLPLCEIQLAMRGGCFARFHLSSKYEFAHRLYYGSNPLKFCSLAEPCPHTNIANPL